MRLNGKAAIMAYIGRDKRHWRGWIAVKLRYGHVIRLLDKHGKVPRYWTHSEEIDAVDLASGCTVHDAEYDKLVMLHTTGQETTPRARRLRQETRELVPA